MANRKDYEEIFKECLGEEEVSHLSYQDVEAWDSVGHMIIVAALEEKFDIEMDIDDIIDMSSFEVGKEILSKYGVNFDE
jgi:acyl carrier protein